MRYDEMTPTLMTTDKLEDGMVVARGEYDAKTREITLRGKGAPREWRGDDIVTTDKMVNFGRDQYVTDGTVIVVGRVKAAPAPKVDHGRDTDTVKVTKPRKRGGRVCSDCGRNLSPNPKAQHVCATPASSPATTEAARGDDADYAVLRDLIDAATLTASQRYALIKRLTA